MSDLRIHVVKGVRASDYDLAELKARGPLKVQVNVKGVLRVISVVLRHVPAKAVRE
jgi:hypothetical protein